MAWSTGREARRRVGLFAANRPEWHTADFAINVPAGSPSHFISTNRRTHDYILSIPARAVIIVAGASS